MAGSKNGGLKTAKTNKRKYGRNYYKKIGAMGGKASGKGGFYHMMLNNRDRLMEISTAAGQLGKRGPAREEA